MIKIGVQIRTPKGRFIAPVDPDNCETRHGHQTNLHFVITTMSSLSPQVQVFSYRAVASPASVHCRLQPVEQHSLPRGQSASRLHSSGGGLGQYRPLGSGGQPPRPAEMESTCQTSVSTELLGLLIDVCDGFPVTGFAFHCTYIQFFDIVFTLHGSHEGCLMLSAAE